MSILVSAMKFSLLLITLALASLMFLAKTQCDDCTSGTFCYTQDNTFSGALNTSASTYCANCMSNCAVCSDSNSCSQCDSGYNYDGDVCTTVSNLELISTNMSNFNIIWIVIIVVGVMVIVGATAISFYCLSKKNKNKLKVYEINNVKE